VRRIPITRPRGRVSTIFDVYTLFYKVHTRAHGNLTIIPICIDILLFFFIILILLKLLYTALRLTVEVVCSRDSWSRRLSKC